MRLPAQVFDSVWPKTARKVHLLQRGMKVDTNEYKAVQPAIYVICGSMLNLRADLPLPAFLGG